MSTTWHADDDLLARYVRGDAGAVQGASLEQHLIHCADCRARIASLRRRSAAGPGVGADPGAGPGARAEPALSGC